MARNRGKRTDDHLTVERTRTGTVWVAVVIAVIFLILLIDFIAQNSERVSLHFLGASGHASLAVALLVAAVSGAVIVVLVSAARILQLRLTAHRHNRAAKRSASSSKGEPESVKAE